MSASGEFGLIEWMRRNTAGLPNAAGLIKHGIGDDCAVLSGSLPGELLVTTDMLMDGRHFRTSEHAAEEIARKALLVSVSDIAAMAGRPIAVVVAVALPRHPHGQDDPARLGRALHWGLEQAARDYDVHLIGGDTNAWDGLLVICTTVLGLATGAGPVMRSGARVGDALFVTGPLGGSLLGRHLKPRPRVALAQALHERVGLRAMIDISDGLAGDLEHILAESGGLGATLEASAIPVHGDAVSLAARDGGTPLDHALSDGEDFELLFCVAAEDAERVREQGFDDDAVGRPVQIGVIEAEPGIRMRGQDGRVHLLEVSGFDHMRAGGERGS